MARMANLAMVAAVVGVTATLTANTLQTPPPAAPPKAKAPATQTKPAPEKTAPPKPAPAQTKAPADGMTLGSASLSGNVTADGKPLPAGTYTVRISSDPVTPVVGQPAGAEKWVEFVQGGQVKGRELASVVGPADIKAIAEETPPA